MTTVGPDEQDPSGELVIPEAIVEAVPPSGMKSIGFVIGERRNGGSVTWPTRLYSLNGIRWGFALFVPVSCWDGSERDAIRRRPSVA
jgi:hypothetical protein